MTNGGGPPRRVEATEAVEALLLLEEGPSSSTGTACGSTFATPPAYHPWAFRADLPANIFLLRREHAVPADTPVARHVVYETTHGFLAAASARILSTQSSQVLEARVAALRAGVGEVIGSSNLEVFYHNLYPLIARSALGHHLPSFQNCFGPGAERVNLEKHLLAPSNRNNNLFTLSHDLIANDPRFPGNMTLIDAHSSLPRENLLLNGLVYNIIDHSHLADCNIFGPESSWYETGDNGFPPYDMASGTMRSGKHFWADPTHRTNYLKMAMSNPWLLPIRAYAGSKAEHGLKMSPYDAYQPFTTINVNPTATPFVMEFFNDEIATVTGLRAYEVHPQLRASNTDLLGWRPVVCSTMPAFNPLPYGALLPTMPKVGQHHGPKAVPTSPVDPFGITYAVKSRIQNFQGFDMDNNRVPCACSVCVGEQPLSRDLLPTGQYNLTIVLATSNCPKWIIPAVLAWARVPQVSFAFGGFALALEVGDKESNFHIQACIFTNGAVSGKSGGTNIVNSLKTWLFPEYAPNGGKHKRSIHKNFQIRAKELTQHSYDLHNRMGALAYLLKDMDKKHYTLYLVGPISANDMRIAKELAIERNSCAAKKNTKATIKPHNFLNRALAFAAVSYPDANIPDIRQLAYDLINHCPRYISPDFARKPGTFEFDANKLQIIFNIGCSSRHPYVSKDDTSYLFFGETSSRRIMPHTGGAAVPGAAVPGPSRSTSSSSSTSNSESHPPLRHRVTPRRCRRRNTKARYFVDDEADDSDERKQNEDDDADDGDISGSFIASDRPSSQLTKDSYDDGLNI